MSDTKIYVNLLGDWKLLEDDDRINDEKVKDWLVDNMLTDNETIACFVNVRFGEECSKSKITTFINYQVHKSNLVISSTYLNPNDAKLQ